MTINISVTVTDPVGADVTTRLDRIERKIDTMATTQAQFDAALQTFETELSAAVGDATAAIDALVAKIGAEAPAVDLSAELAQVQAATASLQGLDTAAIAANPPAAPVGDPGGVAG